MGDEEDKETVFQEAAKRAWVRVFIREASKRGYPIENIVGLLDEPGMTAEAVVERILSTRTKTGLGRQEGIGVSQRAGGVQLATGQGCGGVRARRRPG